MLSKITALHLNYNQRHMDKENHIKKMNLKDLSFDVDEFVLMKSEFIKNPKSVSYKVLERFKLG